MYRIITLIIFFLSGFQLFAATDNKTAKDSVIIEKSNLVKETNMEYAAKLYSRGEFVKSAEIYENILKESGETFEVLYNLGNSRYKSGEFAYAILSFERALSIKPGDRDARFNLELCESKIVDKIVPVGKFLVARWFDYLGNNFNSNGWAKISIVFFIILIASLFAYFFSSFSWLKKVGFYTSLFSLIFTILALSFSSKKYKESINPDKAILFTPTVTVKSSPDKSGTDLFILHEGTKVRIKSELGSWKEIEIADGNVGWIESKHIVVI